MSCVKIWFGLVELFKSYRGNRPKKKKRKLNFWGQKSPIRGGRGLHLTFDAHFRTRMSYSSQKSCVKIWFGLIEIRGMQNFRAEEGEAEAPY